MSDLAGFGILLFSCQGVMGGLRDRNQDSLRIRSVCVSPRPSSKRHFSPFIGQSADQDVQPLRTSRIRPIYRVQAQEVKPRPPSKP